MSLLEGCHAYLLLLFLLFSVSTANIYEPQMGPELAQSTINSSHQRNIKRSIMDEKVKPNMQALPEPKFPNFDKEVGPVLPGAFSFLFRKAPTVGGHLNWGRNPTIWGSLPQGFISRPQDRNGLSRNTQDLSYWASNPSLWGKRNFWSARGKKSSPGPDKDGAKGDIIDANNLPWLLDSMFVDPSYWTNRGKKDKMATSLAQAAKRLQAINHPDVPSRNEFWTLRGKKSNDNIPWPLGEGQPTESYWTPRGKKLDAPGTPKNYWINRGRREYWSPDQTKYPISLNSGKTTLKSLFEKAMWFNGHNNMDYRPSLRGKKDSDDELFPEIDLYTDFVAPRG